MFHDRSKTNEEVYRDGLKLVREAAGKDVFLLGCNIAQNMRTLGGSIGLVDAMRVGPDIKADWSAVVRCARPATYLYFLNGRVWHNDPDCVMLRDPLTLDNARAWATFVALSGQLNLVSEWLPDLPAEKLDVYKRTIPNHRNLSARPVDLFEHEMPRVWQLTSGQGEERRDVVALFNWNAPPSTRPTTAPAPEEPTTARSDASTMLQPSPATVRLDLKALGLAEGNYVGFDYWDKQFIPNLRDGMEFRLPAGSCKVIAIVRKLSRPQVVSNSRHVAQENLDQTYVRWQNDAHELKARSRVVQGDPLELRIDAGGWRLSDFDVAGDALAAGKPTQEGDAVRVTITSKATREIEWTMRFGR